MITSKSKKKEGAVRLRKKNYRPPRPKEREGRLFPPEQSLKTLRLLNELPAGGNKILYLNFYILRLAPPGAARER
jgi:hypothetical protein